MINANSPWISILTLRFLWESGNASPMGLSDDFHIEDGETEPEVKKTQS